MSLSDCTSVGVVQVHRVGLESARGSKPTADTLRRVEGAPKPARHRPDVYHARPSEVTTTEAHPFVDLSDFQPAELSDFGPALTPDTRLSTKARFMQECGEVFEP